MPGSCAVMGGFNPPPPPTSPPYFEHCLLYPNNRDVSTHTDHEIRRRSIATWRGAQNHCCWVSLRSTRCRLAQRARPFSCRPTHKLSEAETDCTLPGGNTRAIEQRSYHEDWTLEFGEPTKTGYSSKWLLNLNIYIKRSWWSVPETPAVSMSTGREHTARRPTGGRWARRW